MIAIQRITALIDIAKLDGIANLDGAAIGLFLPGYHFEQGGFTRAIWTNNPDNTAGRQLESEITNQQAIIKALVEVFGFDNNATKTWPRRDGDLRRSHLFRLSLVTKLIISIDTCL